MIYALLNSDNGDDDDNGNILSFTECLLICMKLSAKYSVCCGSPTVTKRKHG